MTDPANCGAVGNVAFLPHATAACVGGTVVLVACHTGWQNLNGSLVDGCEWQMDNFEPNNSMGAASNVEWGNLVANIGQQDQDWFVYHAECDLFIPCSPRFNLAMNGTGQIEVYEDGAFVNAHFASVSVGQRFTNHVYHVRVVGPPGSSYQLSAFEH